MKQLIKLLALFILMSVLTSSSKDSGSSIESRSASDCRASCLAAKNDLATNVSCSQSATVAEKDDDAHIASLADNEISLSPISRFILVQ